MTKLETDIVAPPNTDPDLVKAVNEILTANTLVMEEVGIQVNDYNFFVIDAELVKRSAVLLKAKRGIAN